MAFKLPRQLPVLRTQHLRLRPLRPEDSAELLAIYGDAEAMRHASDPPFRDLATVAMMLHSVATQLEQGESLEWGIALADDDLLIGTCGLHGFEPARRAAEVGCMLARSRWGQGHAREALPELFRYARDELALRRLVADIDDINTRSLRLFASLGFAPVGGTLHERPLR